MNERKKRRIFVVQKHSASRLHYDFRIEQDGVLKSWALPKEPPTQRGLKRLAIAVEDHDISYANFVGTIPEREYGAGTVEHWDSGTYDLEKMNEREIVIALNGKKLNGSYCLIKLKPEHTNDMNWLFFKRKQSERALNE